MSIETLKSALPEYAKDLKLNLASVAADPALTDQQRWGALVATAIASRNGVVTRALEAEAAAKLAPEALTAAKTAAAIMAMNNIYYRFVHLAGQDDYRTMPARLRMNALSRPGASRARRSKPRYGSPRSSTPWLSHSKRRIRPWRSSLRPFEALSTLWRPVPGRIGLR